MKTTAPVKAYLLPLQMITGLAGPIVKTQTHFLIRQCSTKQPDNLGLEYIGVRGSAERRDSSISFLSALENKKLDQQQLLLLQSFTSSSKRS